MFQAHTDRAVDLSEDPVRPRAGGGGIAVDDRSTSGPLGVASAATAAESADESRGPLFDFKSMALEIFIVLGDAGLESTSPRCENDRNVMVSFWSSRACASLRRRSEGVSGVGWCVFRAPRGTWYGKESTG